MDAISFKVKNPEAASDGSVDFSLQLVGSLPVHSLTTMTVLPWIVAEIRRRSTESLKEESSTKQIRLYVSPMRLRCEADTGKNQQWDPLICSSLFECRPQHVHKLIHNSHDPSYFACLIKDGSVNQQSVCYVFKADDQTQISDCEAKDREFNISRCLPGDKPTLGKLHGLRMPPEEGDGYENVGKLTLSPSTMQHFKQPIRSTLNDKRRVGELAETGSKEGDYGEHQNTSDQRANVDTGVQTIIRSSNQNRSV